MFTAKFFRDDECSKVKSGYRENKGFILIKREKKVQSTDETKKNYKKLLNDVI